MSNSFLKFQDVNMYMHYVVLIDSERSILKFQDIWIHI